jgi:hypothetical protein
MITALTIFGVLLICIGLGTIVVLWIMGEL